MNDICKDFFKDMLIIFLIIFTIFSLEIGPRFPRHRGGNRSPVSSKILPWKSVPNLERARGGPSLRLFAYKLRSPPTTPNSGGQPAHTRAFATHPSPRAPARQPQIQTPKSKIQTCRLDFGFWILDFGFWILDFGFWILDLGFWILDLGFWISDFGFWIFEFGIS